MALTYSTLVQAIKDYTDYEYTVFVAQIDRFIKNAEQRILLDVQLPVFRRNQQGTLNADNKYLALPNDFLAPFSLSVVSSNTYDFLLNKDVNFIQESYPDTTYRGSDARCSVHDGVSLFLRAGWFVCYKHVNMAFKQCLRLFAVCRARGGVHFYERRHRVAELLSGALSGDAAKAQKLRRRA